MSEAPLRDQSDEIVAQSEPATAPTERRGPAIPWGWVRALLMLVAYLVVLVAAGVAVGTVMALRSLAGGEVDPESLSRLAEGRELGLATLGATQVLSLIGIVAVVWAFRRFIDRRSVASLGLPVAGFAGQLGQGLLWGAGLITVGWSMMRVFGMLEVVVPDPRLGLAQLVGYLGVLGVVAFNEELLIRGYVLSNLMDSCNRWLALALSALVFAALHLFNANLSLVGFVNLVLAGVVLGVYVVHRRNLWFSIGMHLTWNFFQGPVFGFEVSGLVTPSLLGQRLDGPAVVTGGEFGLEGSMVTTVLLLAMAAAIHRLYRLPPSSAAVARDEPMAAL